MLGINLSFLIIPNHAADFLISQEYGNPVTSVDGIYTYLQLISEPKEILIEYPGSLHKPHYEVDCFQLSADTEQRPAAQRRK